MLGTGSFGRVSLARHRATGMVCAIKALSKAHIVKNQQVRRAGDASRGGGMGDSRPVAVLQLPAQQPLRVWASRGA